MEQDENPELETEEENDCISSSSIFPEEIWEYVLYKLEDPHDLLNCAAASKYLAALAQPLKKLILFQEVLNILDKNNYLARSDLPDILSWRLVCSSWRTAVNHLLESRPYHSICASPSELSSGCVQGQATSDLAFPTYFRIYSYDLEKLETEIIPDLVNSSISHCPVPSRHLELIESNIYEEANKLEITSTDAAQRYHAVIVQFLQKVGCHFWHSVISYGMFENDIDEWYMRLWQYVELMPNLRSLYIICNVPNRNINYVPKEHLLFPHLKHLKLLSLHNVPEPIVQAIMDQNNPKMLEIERKRNSYNFLTTWVKIPEQLSLDFINVGEFLRMRNEWRPSILLLNFNKFSWEGFSVRDIFSKLEEYKDSLVELSLELPELFGDNEKQLLKRSLETLDLPKVKMLTFQRCNACSLDFLVGMRKLEIFNIISCRSENCSWEANVECKSEVFSYHGNSDDTERFEDSNIWKLMPNLKQISVGRRVLRDSKEYYSYTILYYILIVFIISYISCKPKF